LEDKRVGDGRITKELGNSDGFERYLKKSA